MSRGARAALVLLLVAVALAVQRWAPWEVGFEFGAPDARSYEAIARAAPAQPAEALPYHHAQRWPGPYAAGLVAKLLGIDPRTAVACATSACLLAALLLLQACLARAQLPPRVEAVALSAFALHFSLHYYLFAPGMLPDAFFMAGLALVLYGLVAGRLGLVLAGMLAAALARQTALLILPGLTYWIARGEGWTQRTVAARAAAVAMAALLAAGIYVASGITAQPFAGPSENLESISALFGWIAGSEFSFAGLAVFVAGGVLGLLLPAAILAAARLRRPAVAVSHEVAACLLIVAAIASQPILGGPEFTGAGNALRLAALGLVPLTYAMATTLAAGGTDLRPWPAALLLLLLAASTLHYRHTFIGPRSVEEFAVLQFVLAALAAGTVLIRARERS